MTDNSINLIKDGKVKSQDDVEAEIREKWGKFVNGSSVIKTGGTRLYNNDPTGLLLKGDAGKIWDHLAIPGCIVIDDPLALGAEKFKEQYECTFDEPTPMPVSVAINITPNEGIKKP